MISSLKYNKLFRFLFKYPLRWRAAWLGRPIARQRALLETVIKGGELMVCPGNIKGSFLMPATSELAIRIMVTGNYEPKLSRIITQAWTGPGDILNIGANVGIWSIGALDLCAGVGRVFAIEPNPEAYRCLEQNIALNNAASQVVPINACVAAHEGQVGFEIIPGKPEYSSISGIVHGAVSDQKRVTINVPAKPLDKFTGINGSNIRLVIIDIEGAEYLVINGARDWFAAYHPTILFECSQSLLAKFGHSVRMLRTTLEQIGYEVRIAEAQNLCVPDEFEGDAIAYKKP